MRHSLRNQSSIHFALGMSTEPWKNTHTASRGKRWLWVRASPRSCWVQIKGHTPAQTWEIDCHSPHLPSSSLPGAAAAPIPSPGSHPCPVLCMPCPWRGTAAGRECPKPKSRWCLYRAATVGVLGLFSSLLCLQTSVSQKSQRGPCRSAGGSSEAEWLPCSCLCPGVLCHQHDVPSPWYFSGCGDRGAGNRLSQSV